ncbi:MAG: MarR family transcriptional regulator [Candidatus Hadarchaeales archaeon]
MRRRSCGLAIAIVVSLVTATGAYILLNQLYGQAYAITSTHTITLENSGKRAIVASVGYEVTGAEVVQVAENENFYRLSLENFHIMYDNAPTYAPPFSQAIVSKMVVNVPAEAYMKAQTTEEPVTVATVTTTEKVPLNVLPIAAGVGVITGLAVFVVWIGYRQAWGEATLTLLKHGLHDMTVRDIEIIGYIMQKGEFTIPELMKMSKASKLTIWRTVQKLIERGLVKPTDRTRPAANGLGGRGKPSQIYRYIGEVEEG